MNKKFVKNKKYKINNCTNNPYNLIKSKLIDRLGKIRLKNLLICYSF